MPPSRPRLGAEVRQVPIDAYHLSCMKVIMEPLTQEEINALDEWVRGIERNQSPATAALAIEAIAGVRRLLATIRARDAVAHVGVIIEPKKTCNKHADCDAEDRACASAGKPRAYHCWAEDCEECFGC